MSETLDNLLYMRASWNGITFDCTSKELPRMKECPTWTVMTDNPDYKTGTTYTGKSEGLEPIKLTVPTNFSQIYGTLQTAIHNGVEEDLTFVYNDPGDGETKTITVPKCRCIGAVPSGGDNNSASTAEVTFQPKGGLAADMPSVA